MAQFPKQEMDVFSLAHAMISGYQTNPGDFPNADLPALQAATEDLRQFLLGVVCFRAMAKIKTEEKDTAFDALVANMTTQLQQAEVEVDAASYPVKLETIGWGKKTPRNRVTRRISRARSKRSFRVAARSISIGRRR